VRSSLLDKLLGIFFDQLREQGRRHIREAFAHPLIAIGIKADLVAPPLMSDLVGSHQLPVTP
jgi:hypothetical protein